MPVPEESLCDVLPLPLKYFSSTTIADITGDSQLNTVLHLALTPLPSLLYKKSIELDFTVIY